MKDMTPKEETKVEFIVDSIVDIDLFDEMDREQLQVIASHMHFLEVGEGELVFEEGEKGNYVCFVVDGELAVIKDAASGERAVITTMSRGDSIGEMAVVDNFPRSATVIAETASTLVTLTSDEFHELITSHPVVGIKMLKAIARLLSINLRKTSSQLADYMLPLL